MSQNTVQTVNDWLHYFESRHKSPIQLGLSRVLEAARALDVLHWDIPVITVAGTNGKGSTVASLKAIYMAAGYRVATFTSPHLLCFNERIQIDHQHISDEKLAAIFSILHALPQSSELTYFEVSTLAALLYFKQSSPDVMVLEVGMGGRLDATNCIDADLAIITTIDLDHQAYLGDTIEAIGAEKAGIFRLNQHAVYADTMLPYSIQEKAAALHVNLAVLGQDYQFSVTQNQFKFSECLGTKLELPAPHIHTKAFAAAVMAVIKLAPKLSISGDAIKNASQYISLDGRRQWLNTDIPTLVDVAHNPQAVKELLGYLQSVNIQGKIHAIFSSLQDKPLCGLIEIMRPAVDTWYITHLNDTRAPSKEVLQQACDRTFASLFEDVNAAYLAAKRASKPGDVIIAFGSFVLVSAIMRAARFKQGETL